MIIIAPFVTSGVPALGLSPTLRIRNAITGSLVKTDVAMTEIGDGFYKYNFTEYDTNIDYAIRADGTATLANADRYKFASDVSKSDAIILANRIALANARIDPDANTLILYDDEGVIRTWDLTDINGVPTSTNFYKREV